MSVRTSPRQLALALDHTESFAREDFLTGPSNAQALALIESWPDWPGRALCEHARITSSKAESMRISNPGFARRRAIVLRNERCKRNSAGSSTMRGSVLHHRIGWPSLNQGKMPDE